MNDIRPCVRRLAGAVALCSLITMMRAWPASAAAGDSQEADVKAAFLFNFAKFAEWPDMGPGSPLVMCIVGETRLAFALTAMTRGQTVDGRAIDVRTMDPSGGLPCHMLYVARDSARDTSPLLGMLKGRPMLTISDTARFAATGGMIELFAENGRMRFAINVDVVQQSQLRISSRLLRLAKVVRNDDHGQ